MADDVVADVAGEMLKPSTTAHVVDGRLTDVPDTIRTSWNAWCARERHLGRRPPGRSNTARIRYRLMRRALSARSRRADVRCQHEFCYNHPMHERVITRIMEIVGLPHDHAEHMQLLKYSPGEYYRMHHDWIPQQEQVCCRRRLRRHKTLPP